MEVPRLCKTVSVMKDWTHDGRNGLYFALLQMVHVYVNAIYIQSPCQLRLKCSMRVELEDEPSFSIPVTGISIVASTDTVAASDSAACRAWKVEEQTSVEVSRGLWIDRLIWLSFKLQARQLRRVAWAAGFGNSSRRAPLFGPSFVAQKVPSQNNLTTCSHTNGSRFSLDWLVSVKLSYV